MNDLLGASAEAWSANASRGGRTGGYGVTLCNQRVNPRSGEGAMPGQREGSIGDDGCDTGSGQGLDAGTRHAWALIGKGPGGESDATLCQQVAKRSPKRR